MKGSDILLSIIIFLVFIGIYLYTLFKSEFKNIQKQWPKYRCNPAIMPFASQFGHDAGQNFTYCIQSMQSNYMTYLLTPIHYVTNVMGKMMGDILKDINFVRQKIFSLVTNITKIVVSIFSVFINIIIEFQRIIIKIKDVIGKITGIMTSLIYLLTGGILTGSSIIAGPIGDTLNFVRHI